jgi:RecJ-like exonuclease
MKNIRAGLMGLGLILAVLMGNLPAHAATAPPPAMPLNQINESSLGKKFIVEGQVVLAEVNSSGFRFVLSDGLGQVAVLIRDEDFAGLAERTTLNVGATLRAAGKLGKNSKGQLQLVPAKSKDVSVLSASAVLATRAKKYDLGAMTGNDHNALVLVEGKVIEQRSTATSVVIVLQDGTGAQAIAIPRLTAKYVAADWLKVGQSLRVLGRVRATQKVGLQINVVLPADIEVLGTPDP